LPIPDAPATEPQLGDGQTVDPLGSTVAAGTMSPFAEGPPPPLYQPPVAPAAAPLVQAPASAEAIAPGTAQQATGGSRKAMIVVAVLIAAVVAIAAFMKMGH
jgi:small neutral amino acid transporter SnatA (MarC family)